MLPFARPTIKQEELDAVAEVMRSGWITTGPRARALENALAEYLGGGARVRVFNSGTSALETAVLAADIGPGDEVIVPAMTFIASAHAVLRAGATPVLVDVDARTRNITPAALEAAITKKTRAVMPVHFAGLPVDMDGMNEVAGQHGLRVIEDAAHAIGAHYRGRPVGAAGDLVCFSFHPNKNMTTIEGGALVCFDDATAARIERLRFHGIERNTDGGMDVGEWGGKMNLADINAALGLAQLPRLDEFNARRKALAEHYLHTLSAHACLMPPCAGDGHSWHMCAVRVDFARLGTTRAAFQRRLQDHGIATGVHYPAIHTFTLFRRRGYRPEDCPNARVIGEQTLTLPLFPAMTEADVERVCMALAGVIEGFEHGC
jgi:dTDP-4-amino-4,6-dideoxygalactose transaminase